MDRPRYQYGSWNLSQLKAELKLRGAKRTGRKVDLLERLEAYDRNDNFGHRQEDMEPEYEMAIPTQAMENYRDLNTDSKIPFIAYSAILYYLEDFKKTLGSAVKNLYSSQFLRYVKLSTHQNLFYVRSECRAELKKHLSYKIDVCLDIDGTVVEAQCECAAGQGPSAHCKHVCTVLYALYMFSSTGELITEQTCTQQLQTFHQAKPYTGSPIKAKDIPLSNKELNINFDPRPQQFRNEAGYVDHFRSTWLNHPDVNSYPVSQLFAPANTYSLDLDHDYLKVSTSDLWLASQKLTAITENDIQEIEIATRQQSKCKIWQLEHSRRITSSSFGKICLATERTDFLKMANSLTEPMQELHAAPIRHGRKYEAYAIRKYEQLSGTKTSKCGLFVSLERPYLAASPDAILGCDELVEVKCPYSVRDRVISDVSVPFLQSVNGTLCLSKSSHYYYQVQGQLYCTGRQTCRFIVYTFKDLKVITVEKDTLFIDNMIRKLDNFFQVYFKNCVLDKFFFKNYYKYSFQ